MHLQDCDIELVVICLFLHELQHICYTLPCLAFQCFPVYSGVTGQHLTLICILASEVSLKQKRVCANTRRYASLLVPPPLRFWKHTNLVRARDYVRSPHLRHEPSLLTVAMPKVGDFVESLQPHVVWVTVVLKDEVNYITVSCFRILCSVYCLPIITLLHLYAWRSTSFIQWICTWFSIWWIHRSHSKLQRAGHPYVYPSLTQGWCDCQVSITVYL